MKQVISTLLESGFSKRVLGDADVDFLAAFLKCHISAQGGIIGFSKSLLFTPCTTHL
jgi:hypothetical protein